MSRFWQGDRGLSILLVLLVVTFLAAPLRRAGILGSTFLAVTFTLMLVTGVAAVSKSRWAAIVAGVVAVVAMTTEWAGNFFPTLAVEGISSLSSLLFTALASTVVLAHVLRAGPITIHRIMGAAAAYMLLGFTWGEMYHLLWIWAPGAFVSTVPSSFGRPEFYYYSVVTLTTLGYGDVAPVHPLARSLAGLEALTGQLFPAILIARLVSMELLARERVD